MLMPRALEASQNALPGGRGLGGCVWGALGGTSPRLNSSQEGLPAARGSIRRWHQPKRVGSWLHGFDAYQWHAAAQVTGHAGGLAWGASVVGVWFGAWLVKPHLCAPASPALVVACNAAKAIFK